MLKKVLVGSLLASSLVCADNLEVNINSDTLEGAGEFYLNDSYMLNDDANYFLTASYLTSEDSSNHSSSVISLGVKLMSPYVDDRGFTFGLGMKGVLVDAVSSKTFYATPLNAFAKFHFDEKISFDGEYHYAPKILSFSDAESYKEFKVKANYKVIDNGHAFIGKRTLKTTYTGSMSYDFDDSIFFGYKVTF
jgi:hypothetical protein